MSRGGHNWKGSSTVEGTRSLDVIKLVRAGYMSDRWGAWQWTYQDGTKAWIEMRGGKNQIALDYRVRSHSEDWQKVHQPVPIRWTPCHFGGERPWFVCDVRANGVYCGRQVAKLYGAGRLFACRHCYRLGYAVQRGGPMDRVHHHLARLHRKLGGDYDGPDSRPAAKPNWMRRPTYDRIAQQIEAGEERLDVIFTVGAQRIIARADRLQCGRRIRR
jgi:hypothetical protein